MRGVRGKTKQNNCMLDFYMCELWTVQQLHFGGNGFKKNKSTLASSLQEAILADFPVHRFARRHGQDLDQLLCAVVCLLLENSELAANAPRYQRKALLNARIRRNVISATLQDIALEVLEHA